MTLSLQEFGQDLTKNTLNHRNCKILKHKIMVLLYSGRLSMLLYVVYDELCHGRFVFERNGESVCRVMENVSVKRVPRMRRHHPYTC